MYVDKVNPQYNPTVDCDNCANCTYAADIGGSDCVDCLHGFLRQDDGTCRGRLSNDMAYGSQLPHTV